MDKASYTVGWIAPLALEHTAARSSFEQEHGYINVNGYRFLGGRIGQHNIVLGVQSKMGTDAASALATTMQNAFPNIRFFLVVGIGGGVPRYGVAGVATEIVLGDVVVSYPVGNFGGVVRYDSGAWIGHGTLNFVGHTNGPPDTLLGAVTNLRSDHSTGTGTRIPSLLSNMRLKIHEEERLKFEDPGPDKDRLFYDQFPHPNSHQGIDCGLCCNLDFLQQRQHRGTTAIRRTDAPKIHYGNIGSSNQLQLSPTERNRLQNEHSVICFEMEGAGVIQKYPCLIVRGICDYSDSHKNKLWQPYAAATAAAYTRELLESITSADDRQDSKQQEANSILLKDLRTTDPRDDKRRIEDTKGGLMKDLYRWILYDPEYRKWRHTQGSQLLWIKGDPGKGKTMLLCGIVNELNNSIEATDCLCYFFCQATDSRLNHATAVIRGLIFLLVSQRPSLLSHIQQKYDQSGKDLFEDINAWYALMEILENILQDQSLTKMYFIIDALDECSDFPKLLDFLVKISSTFHHVKWLVSSRNWPDIERRLEQAGHQRLSLELNAEYVSGAVEKYIQNKVLQLAHKQKYDRETKDAVLDHLTSNANNTFLWVALVCQALQDISRWKVRERLHAFPSGLNSLYGRMIQQIDNSEDATLCKRILAITAVVYRPIRVTELAGLIDEPGIVTDGDNHETLQEMISLCGSFLTTQNGIVYFVHQSAKDFLLNAFNRVFPLGVEEAHYTVCSKSLQVLERTLRRDVYNLKWPGYPIDEVIIPEPDPLGASRYSCLYWVDHFCDWAIRSTLDSPEENDIANAIEKFMTRKYLCWLEALSLHRMLPKGMVSLAKLGISIQRRNIVTPLLNIVRDAHRFAMFFKSAIETAPLQAYSSALLFSPVHSLSRQNFSSEAPRWVDMKYPVEQDWSPCLQNLEGHGSFVGSLACSPDFTRLVSASTDTIRLWDTESGECLQILEDHYGRVRLVAFSHDNRVVTFTDGKVKIWHAASGECLQTLESPDPDIRCLGFFHDSAELGAVSVRDFEAAMIWNVSRNECIQQTASHKGNTKIQHIYAVAFSRDSIMLAILESNRKQKVWHTNSDEYWVIQDLEDYYFASINFSHDATKLVTWSGYDNKIKLWDSRSGECLRMLEAGHWYMVECIVVSNDLTRLAISNNGGRLIMIWDATSNETSLKSDGSITGISPLDLSHGSTTLVSVKPRHDSPGVKIWDSYSGSDLERFEDCGDVVLQVAFSYCSTILATILRNDAIVLWNIKNGEWLHTLRGHEEEVTTVNFSYDSTKLSSITRHGDLKVWDTVSGKCLSAYESQGSQDNAAHVKSTAFSYDSNRLATGFGNGTIRIWDIPRGHELLMSESHHDSVALTAFSRNSAWLASIARDGTAKLWDCSSGKCLHTLEGYSKSFSLTGSSAAFSYDSTKLAVVLNKVLEKEDLVSVWDIRSGQLLQLLSMAYWPSDISFDPSGFYLHTTVGSIILGNSFATAVTELDTHLQRALYKGLAINDQWITFNSEKLLWLPSSFRPSQSRFGRVVVRGTMIIMETEGGVVALKFELDQLENLFNSLYT